MSKKDKVFIKRKKCKGCIRLFIPKVKYQMFCSKKCCHRYHHQKDWQNPIKRIRELKRGARWKKTHPKEVKEYTKQYNLALKMETLIYYGGNPPKCACCGETEIMFLSIDHTQGGGVKHREQLGLRAGVSSFYGWLKKMNHPKGYQVLCHNCNMAKGFYGYCPHKTKKYGNYKSR